MLSEHQQKGEPLKEVELPSPQLGPCSPKGLELMLILALSHPGIAIALPLAQTIHLLRIQATTGTRGGSLGECV